ncbi:heterokaryon incompatibility protein-domain-containing protein [Pyrenochaeta sp. MPI-SDFR-AT-0127]|nr:heterokaryon incompatibility protein-domain-containing protein [Pyrenochaeta sp. MPI-SDFR-AT-0127]
MIGADDPFLPVTASISGCTDVEKSFHTMMKWIEECLKTHRMLCSAIDRPSDLPLRLIEVNLPNSQNVRLVHKDQEKGYYACLSHCWGVEQPLKSTLKPDTLSKHQQGIPWEDLPKTFQDAILVTRMIGLPYLWIDSLCILQDDLEDWQNQSAQMGDIYKNCMICIAGSASSGPHQGLFREANSTSIDRSLPNVAGLNGLDKIRSRKPLRHDTHNLPLLRRSWVFQERILSPRYLHFADQELIWECMECMTCECGRLSLNDRSRFGWLEPKQHLHATALQYMNGSGSISSVWQAAVRDYSQMFLTKPSDIFPAISGIAKSIQAATGWEYIAGIWKETIICDLAWRAVEPQLSRRCAIWRAPTFSWASLSRHEQEGLGTAGSPVTYDLISVLAAGLFPTRKSSIKSKLYATIVEYKYVLASAHVTGGLESGHIIISGTIVQANLHCQMPERVWQIAPLAKEPLSSSLVHLDFNQDSSDCSVRDGDEVFCLKLLGGSTVPEHRNGEKRLYLVLKKIDADVWEPKAFEGSSAFERIGILRDAYGEEETKLEEASTESSIQRNISVKII